mmetsp:Transcript_33360/g.67330  ORF Transcript_33360/g.67330 Transcript_33360/m.67330 type:complete len:255 (+) Transcript_33360:377-1141(+)
MPSPSSTPTSSRRIAMTSSSNPFSRLASGSFNTPDPKPTPPRCFSSKPISVRISRLLSSSSWSGRAGAAGAATSVSTAALSEAKALPSSTATTSPPTFPSTSAAAASPRRTAVTSANVPLSLAASGAFSIPEPKPGPPLCLSSKPIRVRISRLVRSASSSSSAAASSLQVVLVDAVGALDVSSRAGAASSAIGSGTLSSCSGGVTAYVEGKPMLPPPVAGAAADIGGGGGGGGGGDDDNAFPSLLSFICAILSL